MFPGVLVLTLVVGIFSFSDASAQMAAQMSATCGSAKVEFKAISHSIIGGKSEFYIGDSIPTKFTFTVNGNGYAESGGDVDVVFVMDRSGSMAWNDSSGKIKIDEAKKVLKAGVDMVAQDPDGGSRVGLATFASSSTLNSVLTTNYTAVKDSIDSILASGGTGIGGGLQTAGNHLKSNGNKDFKKFIILASDGAHNTNPPVSAGINSVPKDATVYTIGITDKENEFDRVTLQTIASTAGTGKGKYYEGNAGDLNSIFEDIFEEIDVEFLMEDVSVDFTANEGNANVTLMSPPASKNGSVLTWNNLPDMESTDTFNATIDYKANKEGNDVYLAENPVVVRYTLFGNPCEARLSFDSRAQITIKKKTIYLKNGGDCSGTNAPEKRIFALNDSAVVTACDQDNNPIAVDWSSSKQLCVSIEGSSRATKTLKNDGTECFRTIKASKVNYDPDSIMLGFIEYKPGSGENINEDEIWKEIAP